MLPPVEKLKVLFLCTGNSCRSQMAQGWAGALRPNAIEAYSAGVDPHGMNPRAIKVMAAVGVDISSQHCKQVEIQGLIQRFDQYVSPTR